MNEASDRIDVSADTLGRVLGRCVRRFRLPGQLARRAVLSESRRAAIGGTRRRPARVVHQFARFVCRDVVDGTARRGRARRQQDRPLGRPQPAAQPANRRIHRRRRQPVPPEVERSGRPTCLVFLHRPADDRASLLAALAEAQARKRAILESSLDPIITINHEGVITEFNKAAEQTFGHPREKVLGSKPSDVLFPAAASAERAGPHQPLSRRGRGLAVGPPRRGHGRPRERRHLRRRNGDDHQPGARRPGAHVLHPRRQPPQEGRAGAIAVRGRARAVEPRVGAVRLRRLARSPGAACEKSALSAIACK